MSCGRRRYLTVPYQPYRTNHTNIPHEYDFLTKIIWCCFCPLDIRQTFQRTLEVISLVQSRECLIVWLSRYRENEAALDDLLERIAVLRSQLESPKSVALSGMPHGSVSEHDPFFRGLAKIEDLEARAQDLLEVSRKLYRELNDNIDQIAGKGGAEKRCILRCRYIDGFPWNTVCEILFSRKPDFDDKMETYLRRTFRIHNEALEVLSQIVPDILGQEINDKRGDRK